MGKQSVKKNYIYNLIYQVLAIILPLVTTPYISRVLGVENIGIYSYTFSIVTYFIIFGNLGVSMYGQREIAYLQDDIYNRSKIFWEIEIVKLIFTMLSGLMYICFFVFGDQYNIYYLLLTLYLVSTAIEVVWFFQGIEDFKSTVIRNIIVRLLCVVGVFVFVKDSDDLWIYILIYSLSELVGNILLWKKVPENLVKIKFKELNIIKHIKPTFVLFIPQISLQIYSIIDRTMLGSMITDKSEVGFYEQAQKIIKLMIAIVSSMGTVMSSRISNIFKKGDKEKLDYYMEKTIIFTIFISLPLSLGTIIIANKFVPIFFGEGYESVITILRLIAIIIVLTGMTNLLGTQYLVVTKQERKYSFSVIIGTIINVLLNILLIPLYGSVGASITTIIGQVVILYIQFLITKNEINYFAILKKSYKYVFASFLMLIIGLILDLFLKNNIYSLFIMIIISFIVYTFTLLLLKADIMIEIINYIKSTVNKLKKRISLKINKVTDI